MRRILFAILAAGLVATGCSSASDSPPATEATTTTAAPTTTASPAASSTTVPETTSTTAPAPPFETVSNVVYTSVDGVELKLDIYMPVGASETPVLVTFHGLSPAGKSDPDTVAVAKAAAEAGMLVFAPTWLATDPIPLNAGKLEEGSDVANCAIAFAQANAQEYGGDPALTVVDGFSAGIIPAMDATLSPATEAAPDCVTDAAPMPIRGVVLGDGETFLHGTLHDAPFADDPDGMGGQVASWLDPSNWPEEMTTKFFIWHGSEGGNLRRARDLTSDDGWLGTRDINGSIRTDLERVGAYDDGLISNSDAAALLHLRLTEAGLEVVLDGYEGGHTTRDKIPELVAYFMAAVTD